VIRLVILDRDGVINHDSPNYVRTLAQWQPIDGAIEAIAEVSRMGYPVAVATNQAGVPKGFIQPDELDRMHVALRQAVEAAQGKLSGIHDCRHHPDERCECRKPRPGMLLRACAEAGVPPEQACFVGDSWTDVQAAVAAGCRPVLVMTGNGPKTRERTDLPEDLVVLDSLAALAAWLATA
jgi:D-glycero-D-manno-heptose 1,7-bisphosphate phosphatase